MATGSFGGKQNGAKNKGSGSAAAVDKCVKARCGGCRFSVPGEHSAMCDKELSKHRSLRDLGVNAQAEVGEAREEHECSL